MWLIDCGEVIDPTQTDNTHPTLAFSLDDSKRNILPKEFQIESLPTFFFVKNGKIIDTIKGAQPEELRNKIVSYG